MCDDQDAADLTTQIEILIVGNKGESRSKLSKCKCFSTDATAASLTPWKALTAQLHRKMHFGQYFYHIGLTLHTLQDL